MDLIDLHVHSTASDGTKTPTQVIMEAKRVGLKAMALTDHDTCNGLKEACEAAKGVLEFVPGIEISCSRDKDKELHMLGLYIDYNNAFFLDFVNELSRSRIERNHKMISLITAQGFDITMDEMAEKFGNVTITRAHFARILLDKGYVKSINEAFDKYLGDGKPCYMQRERVNPKEAIDIIHKAGGLAILAHPMLYKLDRVETKKLIGSLVNMGLDGVEALYSTHTESDEIFLRTLAKELSICYSGGSDYHGDNKPLISLGTGRGGLKIGYHILENIKEYHAASQR